MKREFKFRAICDYDTKDGAYGSQMLYFELQTLDDGIVSWPVRKDIHHINDYGSPVMQFTGLKDKNGKEIFEGDILRVYESMDFDPDDKHIRCFEVIWGDDYPAFTLKGYEDLEYNSLQHVTIVESCEIIGNIYEHPHLLIRDSGDEVSDTTGNNQGGDAGKQNG